MGQKTNALRPGVTVFRFAESWCPKYPHRAGWSSLVARQAHNLKVAGSNPAPATIFLTDRDDLSRLRDPEPHRKILYRFVQ